MNFINNRKNRYFILSDGLTICVSPPNCNNVIDIKRECNMPFTRDDIYDVLSGGFTLNRILYSFTLRKIVVQHVLDVDELLDIINTIKHTLVLTNPINKEYA